ncbi:hypothetical protein ACJ73_09391 [Blastomyces percursus]|uniref:RING-type domain-containing protein n=1 Tax=Blastomyces percursus TaxID=1658174 RepID=A0A1J9P6C1_9EURO|nr:hypothetical protein ACJ73_09391 [Blastomyces percursus]
MTSTSCSICSRPFYLPFRWGDTCTHTFCLKCLWRHLANVDPDSHDNPIAACPYCRAREYKFTYDEDMEEYMKDQGITHDRTLEEQQTLHLQLIHINLSGINDAYLIQELDDEYNRAVANEGGCVDTAPTQASAVIAATILAELDELATVPQTRDPNKDEMTQKIVAMLTLRDHIPIRKVRLYRELRGVHFCLDSTQAMLEYSFPEYQLW